MATDEQNMPFIRNLASSDRKIRTSALSTLRTFLSASSTTAHPRTPLENLKLWKGLFFSLWMCDRSIPQQNLCAELAALTTSAIPDDAAVAPWLAAFWATVAREWTSIDVLRLEKFLLLVRRVFASGLEWAFKGVGGKKRGKWDTQKRREALLELFREWPLETTGDLAKVPVGLRLHAMDIWVDEVAKIGFLGEQGQKQEGNEDDDGGETENAIDAEDEAFLNQLRELVETQLKSPSKPVRVRAKDSLADERLPWNKGQGGDEEESDEDEDAWGGFRD